MEGLNANAGNEALVPTTLSNSHGRACRLPKALRLQFPQHYPILVDWLSKALKALGRIKEASVLALYRPKPRGRVKSGEATSTLNKSKWLDSLRKLMIAYLEDTMMIGACMSRPQLQTCRFNF